MINIARRLIFYVLWWATIIIISPIGLLVVALTSEDRRSFLTEIKEVIFVIDN